MRYKLFDFVSRIMHSQRIAESLLKTSAECVLDDNFWLATHVPTVTIGYAATYLAGFILNFAVER